MLIVQVMGMGGGKSVLFMLLAFCSLDGVMVVVMLLVVLWMDLYSGDYAVASIIFVTPELAVIKGFRDFIVLDCVVVDECYVVLEGSWSFWLRLRELREAICEFDNVELVKLNVVEAEVERLGLALRCAIFFSNVDLIEGKAA
ncbi:putative ATP-dependent dna helicase q1 [Colletotrichum asianum]